MANNDLSIRKASAVAQKEIKASAHYAYIVNGITLDGTKFALNELVSVGQCLVKDNVTGKYEKYADGDNEGTPVWPTGKSNPVILDEYVQFKVKDDGTNPDLTAGQVIVHGAVYTAMLLNATEVFKAAVDKHVRLVD